MTDPLEQERESMSDPLEVLFVWPRPLRKRVADILHPFVAIRRYDGELHWHQPVDDKKISRIMWRLGLAASAELGYGNAKHALSPKQTSGLIDDYDAIADMTNVPD